MESAFFGFICYSAQTKTTSVSFSSYGDDSYIQASITLSF